MYKTPSKCLLLSKKVRRNTNRFPGLHKGLRRDTGSRLAFAPPSILSLLRYWSACFSAQKKKSSEKVTTATVTHFSTVLKCPLIQKVFMYYWAGSAEPTFDWFSIFLFSKIKILTSTKDIDYESFAMQPNFKHRTLRND